MREESEEFKTTKKKCCIVENQKRMKATNWLFKAASQFNGTNVKRIVNNEDCLGLNRTSKVRVYTVGNYYHFKDLVVVSSSNQWTSSGS